MDQVIGIDQYGQTYMNLGKSPRKELLKRLGYKKANRLYVDKKDGSTVAIGYVIGNIWITLHELKPIERKL